MGQRPNQQHHRTEAWTMVTSTTSRANPTGLSSLKRKTKKNKYIQHREHRRYRGARNQARSKPDTVDRPVRTARTIVYHLIILQHRDSSVNISPSSRPTSHLKWRVMGHLIFRTRRRKRSSRERVKTAPALSSSLEILGGPQADPGGPG